jgi:hypothetical protein
MLSKIADNKKYDFRTASNFVKIRQLVQKKEK